MQFFKLDVIHTSTIKNTKKINMKIIDASYQIINFYVILL